MSQGVPRNWTVHREKRNPYRSDTKEKVPKDLPKRKKGQEGTKTKVKGSKGEKRISRMI
jgi:hypothetical protein